MLIVSFFLDLMYMYCQNFLPMVGFFLLINRCIFRVQYASDVIVMGFRHGLFDNISGFSVFFQFSGVLYVFAALYRRCLWPINLLMV
jgi:hypothetical protein